MKSSKKEIVDMINDKLSGKSSLTFNEIAILTGYHPKYVLKIKKEILNNTVQLEHGNKNKSSYNALSENEKEKIIKLYKKSTVSLRRFCKFYGTRSYSCLYNLLKENNLLKK